MKLLFEDYEARSFEDRFDLYFRTEVIAKEDGKQHKKGDAYSSYRLVGYGYEYPSLVRRIAQDILTRQDRTIDLSEYATEFNVVVDKIIASVKVEEQDVPISEKEESADHESKE